MMVESANSLIDEHHAVMARGRLAAHLRAPLAERIQDRERELMTRAIREWNGRTLTGDDARAYLAALAELRGLLADLDRDVRLGTEASTRMTARM